MRPSSRRQHCIVLWTSCRSQQIILYHANIVSFITVSFNFLKMTTLVGTKTVADQLSANMLTSSSSHISFDLFCTGPLKVDSVKMTIKKRSAIVFIFTQQRLYTASCSKQARPVSFNKQMQVLNSGGGPHVASVCCSLWCQDLTGNHISSSHPTDCELFEMVGRQTDNYIDTSCIGP